MPLGRHRRGARRRLRHAFRRLRRLRSDHSGKNVNDGDRYGTRILVLWEPTPELKITPRVVYQETNANGFNREEFYNLYDNQFTTAGRPDEGRSQAVSEAWRRVPRQDLARLISSRAMISGPPN